MKEILRYSKKMKITKLNLAKLHPNPDQSASACNEVVERVEALIFEILLFSLLLFFSNS
jgi:hypothetical protein